MARHGRSKIYRLHTMRQFLISLIVIAAALPLHAADRPHIVVLLADDMGFGELSCLNPGRGKIPTPQLDKLAAEGMVFTDAHSGSSVCTPTRYGLLTGRYAWRTRLQSGVLTGGESLIAKDRLTLPKLLKQQGYATAIIGKWHLGMLFDGRHVGGDVPIGAKVTHGPLDYGGFDAFHGFHYSRQMSLWIDHDEVTQKIKPVEMLPKLIAKAVEFIHSRKDKAGEPFFLYVPWNSPHSPVVPSSKWQGRSGLNAHADFVMQTDDAYGQVITALKETRLYENTLIICSSDNGTSGPTSKKSQLEAKGHFPSGYLRGAKADLWDGGHRVPFIAAWKGTIAPGTRNEQLVCLTDLYATFAEIAGANYPASEGVDSISFADALFGESPHTPRQSIIHHSFSGLFSIREGDWKLLCSPGSGGWSSPTPNEAAKNGNPMSQLYDMKNDIGEQHNLISEHPEKARMLRALLDAQIANGRSTPGPKQRNDVDSIVVDKIIGNAD